MKRIMLSTLVLVVVWWGFLVGFYLRMGWRGPAVFVVGVLYGWISLGVVEDA